jgi:hypothetical protein
MPALRYFGCPLAAAVIISALASPAWPASPKGKAASIPPIRWKEGNAGCTFTRGDDGKYRYGLWTDDLGITLTVDSQELQRTGHRLDPFLGLVLSFRYRGTKALDVQADNITLEFVTHAHVVHGALDPNGFSSEYQKNVDAFAEENEHEIQKHPEKKDEKEALVRAYEKELVEVQEFLTTRSLHPVKLDSGSPETTGWIFFRAKDRWIGGWKKKEEFILRVRVENRVFVFPFALPPSGGDVILRRRTD